jgi:hypothetical protein
MSFGKVAGDMLANMGPGMLGGLGKSMQPDPPKMIPDAPDPKSPGTASPNKFKDGGVVKKTGVALVHKGETVIPGDTSGPQISHHRVLADLAGGGLHRALGVKEGSELPDDKIEKARKGKNPHVAEMANLAHGIKAAYGKP